jgi:hypothetical protein
MPVRYIRRMKPLISVGKLSSAWKVEKRVFGILTVVYYPEIKKELRADCCPQYVHHECNGKTFRSFSYEARGGTSMTHV